MIVKKLSDVAFAELHGYDNLTKQVVLGPEDGSHEIVLRYFSLKPGGSSPHHTHDFPHLVKVETGIGTVTDATDNVHQLQSGDYVYVDSNDAHHFSNTGSEPFDFICVVPQRGER